MIVRLFIIRTCLIAVPIALIASRSAPLSTIKAESLRDEIPITISYANNRVTPIIEINIDHQTYQAVFDTGSSGLRILSGAVTGHTIDSIGQRVSYTYGDGAKAINLRGKVMAATMTFGNSKTSAPIRLMSIDSLR